MKRIKGIIMATVVLIILLLSTSASAANEVVMTASSPSGFTMKWKKPAGTGTILGYVIADNDGNALVTVKGASNTTYTFSNLSRGIHEKLWVIAVYDNETNTYKAIGSTYVNTSPEDVEEFTAEVSKKLLTLTGKVPAKATGIQYELINRSTKKKIVKNCDSIYDVNIELNTAYSVRARAYCQNASNGKFYYGNWSTVKYLAAPSVSGGATPNKSGFTLTLKKGKGIRNYTVYVSEKKTSGYKKTATITVTGSSKTTRITKIGSSKLKAKKRYYVVVVPNIIVGNTTVPSETSLQGSIYVMKK